MAFTLAAPASLGILQFSQLDDNYASWQKNRSTMMSTLGTEFDDGNQWRGSGLFSFGFHLTTTQFAAAQIEQQKNPGLFILREGIFPIPYPHPATALQISETKDHNERAKLFASSLTTALSSRVLTAGHFF